MILKKKYREEFEDLRNELNITKNEAAEFKYLHLDCVIVLK